MKLVLLFAAYVLFSMSLSVDELSAAALTALAGVGFGVALRTTERDYRVPLRGFLRWVPRVLASVPRDVWMLSRAYVRGLTMGTPEGREASRPVEPGPRTAAARGRRGLVIWGLSLPPNAFVTAVDYAEDNIVLHELLPGEQSGDAHWPS